MSRTSWNTSKVTNMSGMFQGANSFNGNISDFKTSKVVDMSGMFQNASSFNSDIGTWDTSGVVNMSGMFTGAAAFDKDIGNWNTSNVTNMSGMFQDAVSFNQPIGNWNTSKATNMSGMFRNAPSFNQPITNWNTSNVTDMSGMFQGAAGFNQNITTWNFNSLTNVTNIFPENYTYNVSIIKEFKYKVKRDNTNNISNTSYCPGIINDNNSFKSLTKSYIVDPSDSSLYIVTYSWINFVDNGTTNDGYRFNLIRQQNNDENDPTDVYQSVEDSIDIIQFGGIPLSRDSRGAFADFPGKFSATDSPTILSNTDMRFMFSLTRNNYIDYDTTKIDSIKYWNTENVVNMKYMFSGLMYFNVDISGWNTSNVVNMENMFANALVFNKNIGSWNTSKVTNMKRMFLNARLFNKNIGNWNTSNVTDMTHMFMNAYSFNQDIRNWNTSKVIYMSDMFHAASAFNYDVSNWNRSSVSNNEFIYKHNVGTLNPGIINYNNSFVDLKEDYTLVFYNDNNDINTSMKTFMRYYWTSFTDDGTTNAGLNLYSSAYMYFGINLSTLSSLDIVKFGNVPLSRNSHNGFKNFSGKISATDAPVILSNTNMDSMFSGANMDRYGVSNWNTANVIDMRNMFAYSNFNENISSWNVSNVQNMSSMFRNTPFNQPIGLWNVSNVELMEYMFQENSSFNQSIGLWNVSNVQSMLNMFAASLSFNQPISSWNVSNLIRMENMFASATSFNQDLSNWVINDNAQFSNMFDNATSFNANYSPLYQGTPIYVNQQQYGN